MEPILPNWPVSANCHTPMVRGESIPGMEFAGSFTFTGPWSTVASANITPDPSGIPYYDETLFLNVIRTGQVRARKLSPIMPVMVYKNLTDDSQRHGWKPRPVKAIHEV